jgi:hypothetical protein
MMVHPEGQRYQALILNETIVWFPEIPQSGKIFVPIQLNRNTVFASPERYQVSN